ncbi:tudor domain-containing protein 5 isoform X1 [Fundulus heteroclitus]|uniref:tudor domain-containing protein 5 isoform X1 n=1 Tax=Fundulus heteroclitus TaxID=8078 RepID=UPI00165BA7BA|nr:tudor domain-containing protein 5 isoform X1 [Fundulus heteroclitus]
MNQDDLLVKLKKDVRSLLTSSKLGLDPEQLRRDYVSMLGHPMPLRPLGFRNVMDMVQEMPDVVSVNYSQDGSICLKAVCDENTQNIVELVSRQRISKSEKARKFSSARYHHQTLAAALPRRGRPPPGIPANLRAQLRFLLSQGPLRLSELEVSYLRFYGYPLRVHNYGFYSTGEMLEAAKDMIVIQQGRLGSVLMLREEMRPRPVTPRRTGPIKPSNAPRGPSFQNSTVKVPVLTERPDILAKQGPLKPPESTLYPGNNVSHVSHKLEEGAKSHDPKQASCQDGGHFHQTVLKLERDLQREILENSIAGTVSQELKDKLRKVVGETRGGLSVHDLPAEYKRLFGEDLPFLQSGFHSVTELVGALSDIFLLKPAEDKRGHSWVIVDLKDHENAQPGSADIDGSTDCDEMPPKSYYFSFKESAWEEKCESVKSDEDNDDLKSSKLSTIEEMIPEIYPAVQAHLQSPVPLDAMQNQRLKPPTRRRARELIEVKVEQVESPGSFYIRCSETEEAHALESLMFDMRRCYACPEVSEQYKLLEPFIRQGQVCCVSPSGIWFYRVVIDRVISSTHVEVFFADFGDVTLVQIDSLKFLKSSFSVLPAQAIPSALTGIKPTSSSWTAEATDSFRKLCSDRVFVGALDCYTGDVLQLYLCDTRTDQDIYIHTVLIDQGHGVACRPATATALRVKVTPVSLYLGEGMVDLPEIDKELLLSLKSGDANKDVEEASAKDDDYDEMPSLEMITEDEFIAQIQALDIPSPPTPPSSDSSCAQQEVNPPPKVTTCSPAAPPLLLKMQKQDSSKGALLSPLFLQNSSIQFPLFGARLAGTSTSKQLVH